MGKLVAKEDAIHMRPVMRRVYTAIKVSLSKDWNKIN
jgi:hypothetical protein